MAEKTKGFIIDPSTGAAAQLETILLTDQQARIMRDYKKLVLGPLGLKEALYCDQCWEHNLSHGLHAEVTSERIIMKCRCQLRVYNGPTY